MDELDMKIIEILRKNSRIPFVEIAKTMGISESTVRKRVQALVDSGVILRFTVDLAPSNEVRALVMISISPSTPTSKVSESLERLEGVEHIYEVTGEYDTLAVVAQSDIGCVNHCIEKIRNIPGVTKTNTMIVLRTL